jgi:hypothetical protein
VARFTAASRGRIADAAKQQINTDVDWSTCTARCVSLHDFLARERLFLRARTLPPCIRAHAEFR